MIRTFLTALLLAGTSSFAADEVVFTDPFQQKLVEGWTWLRPAEDTWRVADGRLEMRVLPGNLWGAANNVRNVLSRPAPDVGTNAVEVFVTVANKPSHQYEQVNVAWYYDDSHMVKLGLELVDGRVCIVMGREQADRCRTLGQIPFAVEEVQLRLRVEGKQITGFYRRNATEQWLTAGTGETSVPANGGKPRISLHCYQGAPGAIRWATFKDFRVVRAK